MSEARATQAANDYAAITRARADLAAPVAAEGADELREALRDELAGWPLGAGYYQCTVGTDDAVEMADALLAGPLAPLLAKVQAVEALHAPGQSGTFCSGCGWTFPCPSHRALGGESRG